MSDAPSGNVCALPELVVEAEAYARYPFLQAKELRKARHEKRIGFYQRKQRIFYRADELEAFVGRLLEESYVAPCPETCTSSDDTASSPSPAPAGSTALGMTPELERLGAEALAREISSRPRSNSPRSCSGKAQGSRRSQKAS